MKKISAVVISGLVIAVLGLSFGSAASASEPIASTNGQERSEGACSSFSVSGYGRYQVYERNSITCGYAKEIVQDSFCYGYIGSCMPNGVEIRRIDPGKWKIWKPGRWGFKVRRL